MNRRDLLRMLLATPLAAAIDYEKLLWIPKPQIVVSNLPLKSYIDRRLTDIYVGDLLTTDPDGRLRRVDKITDHLIGVALNSADPGSSVNVLYQGEARVNGLVYTPEEYRLVFTGKT